jgi:hypothetical protein
MTSRYRIRGKVCASGDLSRAGLKIKIIECGSGLANTLLGQAFTDERGHYSCSYSREGSKPKFNIFLEISDRNRVLKKTDIISDVLPDEVKDVLIINEKSRKAQQNTNKSEPQLREKITV